MSHAKTDSTTRDHDFSETYVPDRAIDELPEDSGFRSDFFEEVMIDDALEPMMALRASLASSLASREDPLAFAQRIQVPNHHLKLPSSFPSAVHYTPNFTSDTPGYCGPIIHIQPGGGPEFFTNVVRSNIDAEGNRLDVARGFRVYRMEA